MTEEEALLVKDQSEAQAHSDHEDLKDLLRSAGWQTLCRLLNEQGFEKKQALLLEPLIKRSEDLVMAAAAAEYDKGYLAGLVWAINFPAVHAAVLANQLGLDEPEGDEDV
jgi:phosphoenolpyruvate-protein kinase (PTS system EI component)